LNIINKNQKLLLSGIIGLSIIFLTFGFASAVDDEQFKTAMDLIQSKKTDEAIPILENILKNNPNNMKVLKNLAVAYTETKMCDESVKLYDRILELKPNSPEILYGKAVCYNAMGLPEKSLLILDELGEKFSNETSVLVARGNSHILLQEFDIALEYYQKALEKNPEHKSALTNMILLAKQTSDPILAETYLVKLLGKNPTPSELDPEKGNMPFTMRINDSNIYSATMQMQVRDSSDNLVAIVESEKILYIPHPLMYEIIDHPQLLTETIQDDSGTFEIRKIIVRNEPTITPYFLDRATLSKDGYLVFFAYNMAIPIEEGDYTITEWTIKKKIEI